MSTRNFLSTLVLFLAGCVGMGYDNRSYPSLTRRPAEANVASAPVASVAPPAVVTAPAISDDFAALAPTIEALSAQARDGEAAFEAAYGRVSDQVRSATNAAISSEAWVAANLGISALESARNGSVSALASLDTLYADRMNAIAQGKSTGGADRIDSARRAALAIVDTQNDKLDGLKAALPQP